MPSIPEPRDRAEHHAPRCHRHHVHMVNCPECCDWNRERLKAERDEAQRRHEAAT